MDGKLQIIAGILSLFFLGVAIAKSMVQRARKREAAAKSLANSKSSDMVSLHNPFTDQQPVPSPEPADQPEQQPVATQPAPEPAPAPNAQVESIYKWV